MMVCKKCGEERGDKFFRKDKFMKSGFRSACILCDNKYMSEWKKKNKGKPYLLKKSNRDPEHTKEYNKKRISELMPCYINKKLKQKGWDKDALNANPFVVELYKLLLLNKREIKKQSK